MKIALRKTNFYIIGALCFLHLFVGLNSYAQDGFSANITEGCAPLNVTFSYNSGANPTYLSWDFGTTTLSGDPSINPGLLNPSILYNLPGSYSISLEVIDDNGNTFYNSADYITVYSNPSSNLVADVTEGCGAFPVQFTDLSNEGDGEIVQWNWDFGDGGSSNEQNPIHTYSTIGIFDVSLSVIDNHGCNSIFSIQDYINSTDGVYPTFALNTESSCEIPTTISISNNSYGDGNITYSWDFGNSTTSTLEDPPSITYSSYGTYIISLTMTSDLGCTQSSSIPVIIEEFDAAFEIESSCYPDTTFFTNLSDSPMNTFEWTFGDPSSGSQNTSNQENPYHIFTSSGSFSVSLTASIDGECEDTYSIDIEVLEADDIDFSITSPIICELPYQVPITVNNDNAQGYTWFINHNETIYSLDNGNEDDNIIDFDSNQDIIYEGDYDLNLYVVFDNGCEGFLFEESVITVDTINISALLSPQLMCIGDVLVGNDSTTYLSDIESVTWDWGDGSFSYTDYATHVYSDTGTYLVNLTVVAENGCQNSKSYVVRVGLYTDPSFSYIETTLCIEDSVQFFYTGDPLIVDEYSWSYNGTGQSDEQNPFIIFYNVNTNHQIFLTTYNNGCTDSVLVNVDMNALGPEASIGMSPSFFCKEESPYISYISNQSNTTENTIYQWVFVDDYIDSTTAINPGSLEFFEPGGHQINLYATDTVTGCEHDISANVEISNFQIMFQNLETNGCDELNYSGYMLSTDVFGSDDNLLFTWDFGDNSVGYTNGTTDPYIDHLYSNIGTYLMTTSTISVKGCPDTVSQWIVVHPSPVASFSIETANICPPFELNVTNQSSEMDTSIVSYEYILLSEEDTAFYFEENPVVFIESPIPYELVLVIVDGFGCTDSSSLLLDPHAINMEYNVPENMCYDTFYDIENNITSDYLPLSFEWVFGNGIITNEINPSIYIDFSIPNDFINYVTVTDGSGCTQIDSFYIHMSVPNIGYAYEIDEASCPPIYVDFSIFSIDSILEFGIDFGDGESNYVTTPEDAENISHVYDFPGFYDVTFIVTDSVGCESHIISDSLVFVPGPWANISFDPNFGCPPLEVTFEITDENNVADYFWVFGDGLTSEDPNTTHIYNLAGIYTPILMITDSLNLAEGDSLPCIVTVQEDDIIIEGPILDFFVLDDTLCFGSNSTLNIENTTEDQEGFNITSYEWQFGDGSISYIENPPPYAYNDTGLFAITLTIVTDNGCVYTMEKENAVYVMPPPAILPYSEYTPQCPPMLVNFIADTSNNINPEMEYYWTFGDGQFSNEFSTSHEYLDDQVYLPSLEVSIQGCSFNYQLENSIESFPVPEAIINAIPYFTNNSISEIELINESIDEDYIEWTINSQFYSNEGEIIISIEEDSSIIQLIAYNDLGCMDSTYFSLLDFDWDIANVITPNNDGKNDFFVLNLSGFGACIELQIFNRWGTKVYENTNYQDNWNGKNKNGQKLSDGTYFYIVNVCNKSQIAGYITILH